MIFRGVEIPGDIEGFSVSVSECHPDTIQLAQQISPEGDSLPMKVCPF